MELFSSTNDMWKLTRKRSTWHTHLTGVDSREHWEAGLQLCPPGLQGAADAPLVYLWPTQLNMALVSMRHKHIVHISCQNKVLDTLGTSFCTVYAFYNIRYITQDQLLYCLVVLGFELKASVGRYSTTWVTPLSLSTLDTFQVGSLPGLPELQSSYLCLPIAIMTGVWHHAQFIDSDRVLLFARLLNFFVSFQTYCYLPRTNIKGE
jgi:hypothetical protein